MTDKKIYQVSYAYPHMYLPASKVAALEKRLRDLAKETGDNITIHQPCAPEDRKQKFNLVFIECSKDFADRVAALQFGMALARTGVCLKVEDATVMTAPKPPAKTSIIKKFGF